jgi:hypothetical protein
LAGRVWGMELGFLFDRTRGSVRDLGQYRTTGEVE